MDPLWFPIAPLSQALACFSPPVMISTFIIEFVFAIYLAFKYPPSLLRNIVVTVLVCLASFQLAEYQVCQGPAATALGWTKFGLVGISFLPAMGMHIMGLLTRWSPLIPLGYLMAVLYTAVFLFVPGATGPAECHGNYVMLNIQSGLVARVYDWYYTAFLALAMVELALRLMQSNPPQGSGYSPRLVGLMLFGYLSFTVPMACVALFFEHLRSATPSIMCGFALFLAFILTFAVVPTHARESEILLTA